MKTFKKTAAVGFAALALAAALGGAVPAAAEDRGFFGRLFPGKGFVDEDAARERAAAIARRGPSNRPIFPEAGKLSYGGRQPLLVRKEYPDGGSTIIFF